MVRNGVAFSLAMAGVYLSVGCALAGDPPTNLSNSIGMTFRLIPKGEFMMGPKRDPMGFAPRHRVQITRQFYMSVTEVTQEQYASIMDENPSHFSSDERQSAGEDTDTSHFPVERVRWDDAKDFCEKLSEKEGRHYRLPTEAEWEYACRAGTTTQWHFGDDKTKLKSHAWYKENSDRRTHPVAQKKPNDWGLYDMYGNVAEWCSDWFHLDYYRFSPTVDPPGPAEGEPMGVFRNSTARVIRGGGWGNVARTSASRDEHLAEDAWMGLGFRVVLEVPTK